MLFQCHLAPDSAIWLRFSVRPFLLSGLLGEDERHDGGDAPSPVGDVDGFPARGDVVEYVGEVRPQFADGDLGRRFLIHAPMLHGVSVRTLVYAGVMKVRQACKFAIDPAPADERAFRSHAGASRFAWNWGLARCKERYAAEGKWYSAIDLHKLWNAEKKANPDLAWWSGNSKCACQEAFRTHEPTAGLARKIEDGSARILSATVSRTAQRHGPGCQRGDKPAQPRGQWDREAKRLRRDRKTRPSRARPRETGTRHRTCGSDRDRRPARAGCGMSALSGAQPATGGDGER